MNADGTNQTQLTVYGPGRRRGPSPTWSPDGTAGSSSTDGRAMRSTTGLIVMKPDGSGRMTILGTQWLRQPDWQPITAQLPAAEGRISAVASRWCPAYEHCTAANRNTRAAARIRLVRPPAARLFILDGRHAGYERPSRPSPLGTVRAEVIAGNPGPRSTRQTCGSRLLADGRAQCHGPRRLHRRRIGPASWCAGPTRRASPSTPRRALMVDRIFSPSTPHVLTDGRARRAPPVAPRPAPTHSSRAPCRRAGGDLGTRAGPGVRRRRRTATPPPATTRSSRSSGLFVP